MRCRQANCAVTSLHRHETCGMCNTTVLVDYCDDGLDRCANCNMDLCAECIAADTACDESKSGHGSHVMRSEVGPDDVPAWSPEPSAFTNAWNGR